ncbi:hypothetical protein [Xenorhabdus thuongxuanensis]|uniref:Uncharacterized protein n=1 Tax=Xenorhabdus thuongxuanensis TaxID=1873484 RepID=A0A1Q5TMW3_9GAMM|nr:hypothetical protein [Xenorhabdus thuongxuanensis]OKP01532.1 hypothetical protein Xentx_03405 [Xenorhabdus thuongxuanensis]
MDIKNKSEFKKHILITYMANQKHEEPIPNYSLEVFQDCVYVLYKRNGRYMYLVDVFLSYEDANKQAKEILDLKYKLKNNVKWKIDNPKKLTEVNHE